MRKQGSSVVVICGDNAIASVREQMEEQLFGGVPHYICVPGGPVQLCLEESRAIIMDMVLFMVGAKKATRVFLVMHGPNCGMVNHCLGHAATAEEATEVAQDILLASRKYLSGFLPVGVDLRILYLSRGQICEF